MITLDTRRRYLNDPIFHALVHKLQALAPSGLTTSDVRQACDVVEAMSVQGAFRARDEQGIADFKAERLGSRTVITAIRGTLAALSCWHLVELREAEVYFLRVGVYFTCPECSRPTVEKS